MAAICASALLDARVATAQHGDIAFGYVDNKIHILLGPEGRVFEGNFVTSGSVEQSTDSPGFVTFSSLSANDVIDYKILSPLAYHSGTSFEAVPFGASITIGDNPPNPGSLIVDASTVGPTTGPGSISKAGATGVIHSHIDFDLRPLALDAPEYGAYGLLMSLASFESDGTTPTGIADSDPFYIVFNFGLGVAQYEHAVSEFSAQVPEPTSLAPLGFACVAMLRRYRSI